MQVEGPGNYDARVQTVLFVCTGNTCRSPMAQAIATNYADSTAGDFFAISAGLTTMDGLPVSTETLKTLKGLSIQHDGRSLKLTADMAAKADLVLCMTRSHCEGVRQLLESAGESAQRVHLLCPDGADLPDPIGQAQSIYDALGRRMAKLIPARIDELLVPASD